MTTGLVTLLPLVLAFRGDRSIADVAAWIDER
jgi:hypothetical protein